MRKITLFISFCLIGIQLYGQNCPEGNNQFEAKQYSNALRELQQCLVTFPTDSAVVFMSGYSQMMLKNYTKAIALLKQSIDLHYQPLHSAQYALGLSYASLKDSKNSLIYLDSAVQNGFVAFTRLDSPHFDNYRKNEKFASIYEDAYKNAFPCLKDNNNNKFDFWLGEWDVFVNGSKIAESSITKAKGGCAVHEDFVVLNGYYAGQSISYYDTEEKRWHQYWVGSAGDKSKYYETKDYGPEADLQFLTKSTNPKGVESWTKMSYKQEDENTVVQTLIFSTDKGETWTSSFAGNYKRKSK